MTSLLITGYLALSKGRRVASENPNTHKTTHHMYYDTVIQTCGVDVPAELRYWVPSTEKELPDGTIADVFAKVYAPSNSVMLLDAIQFTPFPGDASSPQYEDSIPDRPFPTVIVLGSTSGAAETLEDGVSIGYAVQTSEYVRDQTRTSKVYCRFDGTKARWKKAPRPSSGSAVFVVGLAYGLHLAGGNLMIDVDQVQLNVGTTSTASSSARVDAGGPPAKRRRFPISSAAAPASSLKESSSAGIVNGTSEVIADDGVGAVDSSSGRSTVEAPAPKARRQTGAKRKAATRRAVVDEEEE